MIERLHYLALPQVEESPRSVLLRTVTQNGYRNMQVMADSLGIRALQPFLIQTGASRLVNELNAEAGVLAEQFQQSFYPQRKGVTSAEPIYVMGTLVPASAILAVKHRICPECLHDGYMRSIQDIEWIDVCPYHGCRYITECPSCGKSFSWVKMRFAVCACGHELDYKNLPLIKDDASGALVLLDRLRKRDGLGVLRLEKLLNAIRFDRQKVVTKRVGLFNQAALMLTDPANGMRDWLDNKKKDHPGIPDRAILASFLAIDDQFMHVVAKELLQTCSPILPSACGDDCKCPDESLSAMDTEVVLGLSAQTLLQLVKKGEIQGKPVGKRGIEYPLSSLCNLYRSFKLNKANAFNGKEISLCPANAFGATIATKLDQLRDGSLVLVQADARKPLGEYLVVPVELPKVEKKVVAPEGYLTVSEISKCLDVYPDAVRRALKAGYISKKAVIGKARAVFIPADDVAGFGKEYIFIGSLARRYNAKITAFSAQLASAGVMPVSGPRIDDGLVALYRRSDLDAHDLGKIATTTNFATKAGRKKGDPQRYDASKWMRSVEVGQILGVGVQLLQKLADYGLLAEGLPPGCEADNTRFFTTESVMAAKEWLESVETIEDVAKKERTTPHQIYIRFVRSGFVRALSIAGRTLLSGIDVVRIREHRKRYCTCAEAAVHVGAQTKHFHNMIKLGKILPASPAESGVSSVILLYWKDVRVKSINLA